MPGKETVAVHGGFRTAKQKRASMKASSSRSEKDDTLDGRSKIGHSLGKRKRSESQSLNDEPPCPPSSKVPRTDQSDAKFSAPFDNTKFLKRDMIRLEARIDDTNKRSESRQKIHADELGSQITGLQERFDETCAQVRTLETSMADVTNRSTVLENTLNAEMNQWRKSHAVLNVKLAVLERKTNDMIAPSYKMAELEKTVANLSSQNADLEKRLSDVQAQRDSDRVQQNRRFDELARLITESNDTKKRSEILEQTQMNNAIDQTRKDSVSEGLSTINDQNTRVTALETEVKRLAKTQMIQGELLIEHNQTLSVNISALYREVYNERKSLQEEYNGRLHALETTREDSQASLATDVSDLKRQAELETFSTDLNGWKSQQLEPAAKSVALSANLRNLHKEDIDRIQILESEQAGLEAELQALGASASDLQHEQHTINNELHELKSGVRLLRNEQDNIQVILNATSAGVSEVQVKQEINQYSMGTISEDVELLKTWQKTISGTCEKTLDVPKGGNTNRKKARAAAPSDSAPLSMISTQSSYIEEPRVVSMSQPGHLFSPLQQHSQPPCPPQNTSTSASYEVTPVMFPPILQLQHPQNPAASHAVSGPSVPHNRVATPMTRFTSQTHNPLASCAIPRPSVLRNCASTSRMPPNPRSDTLVPRTCPFPRPATPANHARTAPKTSGQNFTSVADMLTNTVAGQGTRGSSRV
jgi:chromosome segregation ATPase